MHDEKKGLTKAEKDLYHWLISYINAHQHSPTIRQMQAAMGLNSPCPVQVRLQRLRQKGYVHWKERQPRTLQIVGGVPDGIEVRGRTLPDGGIRKYIPPKYSKLNIHDGQIAVRVADDSFQSLAIAQGDILLFSPLEDGVLPKNGELVLGGIKRRKPQILEFYHYEETAIFEPGFNMVEILEVPIEDAVILGVFKGVLRVVQENQQ